MDIKMGTIAVRMHQYYGESKPNICRDCKYLKKERRGRYHYSCEISNKAHGIVFGFVSSWDACGKFEPKDVQE